ncbi:MAG TPA: magnesium transporter CorA family protein [Gammaproteobacteria bacterium]|nr:magnesium transporter CorA family protein [Gammaproteobacteria bacterium]
MEILYFLNRAKPTVLDKLEELPAEGFVWLDLIRGEDPDWPTLVQKLTGASVHERHARDADNLQHPSYYDSTRQYEMLVFRGLAATDGDQPLASRPTVIFLFDRLLVTIRAAESRSIPLTKDRLQNTQGRIPQRQVGLMHLILNALVDRFLELREPLSLQLETWRRHLLDPRHPFDDWMTLMDHRYQLRTLEMLCEEQEDAIIQWRDNTDIEMDDHLQVRYNDLLEHIRRVTRFAAEQQNSIESLVQLHFSAVAHRTNEIVRVLTILSAIFLPLTLIAGIYGMNFEYMPELGFKPGYFLVLGGMLALALGMLALFKWKRWF